MTVAEPLPVLWAVAGPVTSSVTVPGPVAEMVSVASVVQVMACVPRAGVGVERRVVGGAVGATVGAGCVGGAVVGAAEAGGAVVGGAVGSGAGSGGIVVLGGALVVVPRGSFTREVDELAGVSVGTLSGVDGSAANARTPIAAMRVAAIGVLSRQTYQRAVSRFVRSSGVSEVMVVKGSESRGGSGPRPSEGLGQKGSSS